MNLSQSRHVHRYTQPVIFGTRGEIDGVEYTAAMDGYFSPTDLIGAVDKAETDEPVVIITNNGYWSPATDDQDELVDSLTVERTFTSEEEAIAYLDSLDQEVTTNINTIIDEENTDNV